MDDAPRTVRYLRVYGGAPGFGICDPLGPYLEEDQIDKLSLSPEFRAALADWVQRYQDAFSYGHWEEDKGAPLDQEGYRLCARLREELPGCKVDYSSDALCRWVPFPERLCD